MRFNALVGEVMRRDVKKVDLDTPINEAAKIMRDERIGSVVVVGEKNVKGILTTSDVVYKHVASNRGNVVKDIMSTELVTIDPRKSVEEAAHLMVEKRIEKLLVFDAGKLVGIITNNDILKVEPALFEILLERMRQGAPQTPKMFTCDVCGNSSDVEYDDGQYLCSDCRD